MALNIPQVLVGCCVSSVCILCLRKDEDLVNLQTASNITLFFVKADDKETFERLGKYVTAKENLGEFAKVQVDWQTIKAEANKEFLDRHKELMKDRNGPTDFREGDIVCIGPGKPEYRLKEISQPGYDAYKKTPGWFATEYYHIGNWRDYSYAINVSGYYRVK